MNNRIKGVLRRSGMGATGSFFKVGSLPLYHALWPRATRMIDLLRNLLTGKIAALMEQQEASIDSRIWQVVALIPPGKVATYGDVARPPGGGCVAQPA